jgi:uncharacterized protein (TIGR02996 family)
MTLTDDRAALLATICARDPADPAKLLHPGDGPRLVLADWLEDHGETARGEFVRVQCELSRLEAGPVCLTCGQKHIGPCSFVGVIRALRRRERELWGSWPDVADVRSQILATLPAGWGALPQPMSADLDRHLPAAAVARGFVASIRGPLAALIGGGPCERCDSDRCEVPVPQQLPCRRFRRDTPAQPWCKPCRDRDHCPNCSDTGRTPTPLAAIMAAHPLERIETDREPLRGEGSEHARWVYDDLNTDDAPYLLPLELLLLLPTGPTCSLIRDADEGTRFWIREYDTRADAIDALSDALLRLGAARAKEMR